MQLYGTSSYADLSQVSDDQSATARENRYENQYMYDMYSCTQSSVIVINILYRYLQPRIRFLRSY
jgi:hypothetical protein|eukprot:COSAG01_NODE_16571_length_1224_cov_8.846222_2_plen_65_part_00